MPPKQFASRVKRQIRGRPETPRHHRLHCRDCALGPSDHTTVHPL